MLLLCHCLATCRMWNPAQYIRRGRRCPQIYLFFLFYPYLCPWTRRPKEPFAGAVGIVRMTMHHCRTNLYGTMTLSHNPSTPNHSNSWNSIATRNYHSIANAIVSPSPSITTEILGGVFGTWWSPKVLGGLSNLHIFKLVIGNQD